MRLLSLPFLLLFALLLLGHNDKHGGAILPDSLRWLWREEK